MDERKPVLWKRFDWYQSRVGGETIIRPYNEFPSHVTCPECGKDVDYRIWLKGGCIYCGCNVSLEEGE